MRQGWKDIFALGIFVEYVGAIPACLYIKHYGERNKRIFNNDRSDYKRSISSGFYYSCDFENMDWVDKMVGFSISTNNTLIKYYDK